MSDKEYGLEKHDSIELLGLSIEVIISKIYGSEKKRYDFEIYEDTFFIGNISLQEKTKKRAYEKLLDLIKYQASIGEINIDFFDESCLLEPKWIEDDKQYKEIEQYFDISPHYFNKITKKRCPQCRFANPHFLKSKGHYRCQRCGSEFDKDFNITLKRTRIACQKCLTVNRVRYRLQTDDYYCTRCKIKVKIVPGPKKSILSGKPFPYWIPGFDNNDK